VNKGLALFAFAFVAIAPLGAQSASGMAAMQYYVGSWSCVGTQTGQQPTKATLTFTLDDSLLREWILVPAQGKMKAPYALAVVTSYDPKHSRYIQTNNDNTSVWSVAYAQAFSGNTEQWVDHANSSGKLGHGTLVRTDQNTFNYTGYPALTGKPNFKAICHRST
jgi:hypothetical protein